MAIDLLSILRNEWLDNIELISGKQPHDIRNYLTTGEYAPLDPFLPKSIALYYSDLSVVNRSYASEVNRFSAASFESIQGIGPDNKLTKSLSWSLIRLYYAAFFAAHALIRLHGRSLTQVDTASCVRVNNLAKAYSTLNSEPLTNGLQRISIKRTPNLIELAKVGEKPHEALWLNFGEVFKPVAQRVLKSATTTEIQEFAVKLMDLLRILSDEGRMPNYNWLSFMRNSINYRQSHSVWHPYGTQPKYCSSLHDIVNQWTDNPNDLNFWPSQDRELQHMVESCVFIVSLCKQCCEDINRAAPDRKSFLKYKALNLLQHIT